MKLLYSLIIQLFCIVILFLSCSKSPSSSNGGGTGSGNNNPPPDSLKVNDNSAYFPSSGSIKTINVTSNINWTVSDDQSWLSTSIANGSNNGSFTISATANTGTTSRNGTVTVSGSSMTRIINVTQAGAPVPNSVTLMRGTGGTALYYDYTSHGELDHYLSQDGYSSSVRMTFDSSAVIRTKLVNAELGTITATPTVTNFGYTHYEIYFSNVNFYTSDAGVSAPDTTGKLQIWIYREDGQDIMPASGGHPAVKKIIQVPGRFPTTPSIAGEIRLLDFDFAGYPAHPPPVTTPSLKDIFSTARWTINLNQFSWQW